jgi:Protein of unknown function (DUF2961)
MAPSSQKLTLSGGMICCLPSIAHICARANKYLPSARLERCLRGSNWIPSIVGSGTEDYFLGAWDFGGKPFSYQLYGAPVVGAEQAGSKSSVYRFHLDQPIPFEKSFKATIEHGNANGRSDNFYSVAYWYQAEPSDPSTALCAAETPKVAAGWRPGKCNDPLCSSYKSSSVKNVNGRPGTYRKLCLRQVREGMKALLGSIPPQIEGAPSFAFFANGGIVESQLSITHSGGHSYRTPSHPDRQCRDDPSNMCNHDDREQRCAGSDRIRYSRQSDCI